VDVVGALMINPELAPHQREAVGKLSNGKILKGGVGSGKTRTALAYFTETGLPPWTPLYIITTAMKRDSGDWQEECKAWGVIATIDSWNNLPSYEAVRGAFFIYDEQRVVGSGVWVKAFIDLGKNNEWILLSATPGDTWLDYAPVFVANGYYKSRAEFLREHVVFAPYVKFPKVQRILGEQQLARQLDEILVEMPYERHTKRHVVDVFAEYDKELFDSVWRGRWNYLLERPVRHVAELFSLMRRVSYTDPSRLQRVRDLLTEHPKMIVFYNFDYELEILRTLDVPMGEWNGHNHDPIPDGNEWVYLVQYLAGSEGWNCTETDTTVFYSPTYSYRKFEQAQGRTDRFNTPYTDLYYFVIRSANVIDFAVFKALEEKRDFNERKALKELEGV
jgi:hypothetical protein